MKIGRTLPALIALLWGLFFAHAASAVALLEDNRIVRTFFDEGSTTTTPDTPFADFSVSYQNTTVNENAFGGSGNGYGESDFTYFIAESTFEVVFEATDITDIALTGFFAADDGTFGAASVHVNLYSVAAAGNQSVVYNETIFGNGEGEFAYSGVLATGVYRLVLHTNITPGGFDTTGYYSFDALFDTSDATDSDADGIPDATDNCTLVSNHRQVDSDGDDIGNQCDPDLFATCQVDYADLAVFRTAFFTSPGDANWNPDADFAGDPADGGPDDVVNFADLDRIRAFFFGQPGPSANGCN